MNVRTWVLAILCSSMSVSSAWAAETRVSAGDGTLAAAVANAADGDTLLLGEGAFSGTVTINKSITIRPVNRATSSLITGDLGVDGAGIAVTIQGLKTTQNLYLARAAAVRVLENTFLSGNVFTSDYKTSEGDGSLVVVGNRFHGGGIFEVRSQDAYIAGNTILYGQIRAEASVWIVGNNVHSESDHAIRASSNDARIIANRISCKNYSQVYCLTVSAAHSLIAGNVVEVEDDDRYGKSHYYQSAIISVQLRISPRLHSI